jgi:hypothetical protein
MYMFDVSYCVDGNNFSKSFLLAESRDGFELQQQLQTLLEQEHVAPVYIMEEQIWKSYNGLYSIQKKEVEILISFFS